jgi:hypothetical protein
LVYFSLIWYILWPFGNVVVIWYILPRFGKQRQEKSGNPDPQVLWNWGNRNRYVHMSRSDNLKSHPFAHTHTSTYLQTLKALFILLEIESVFVSIKKEFEIRASVVALVSTSSVEISRFSSTTQNRSKDLLKVNKSVEIGRTISS